MIGVVTHQNDPQIESVRSFGRTLNVTFPVVWENIGFSESLSKSANDHGIKSALPQLFVIDKEGHPKAF